MDSKKRVRFNIIDFFIIICLTASCCFFSYYAINRVRKNDAAATDTLTYTVKITNLSSSSADLFVLGDNVSRTETALPAGTITDVKKTNYTYLAPAPSGANFVSRTDNNRFDVMLTVKSGFSEDETSFIVGGNKIKIGQPIHAFTDRISFDGTVYDISLDDN